MLNKVGVTDVNLSLRILNLLSTKLTYLMFRGGSGGEFLTNQIYKYSQIYKNDSVDCYVNNNVNRTLLTYPKFFNVLAAAPQQVHNLIGHLTNNVTEEMVTEAEEFVNNHFLVRCHYINSPVIIRNSFFILLDQERWFDYAGLLSAIKNQIHKDNIKSLLSWYRIRYNSPLSDINLDYACSKITEYMNKHDLEYISDICTLVIQDDNIKSIETLLSGSIVDVYNRYKYKIHGEFDRYKDDMSSKKFKKIINYSEYFNKGYLEEIFNIDNNNFNYELLEWHERNLELLSINGVDISKFK